MYVYAYMRTHFTLFHGMSAYLQMHSDFIAPHIQRYKLLHTYRFLHVYVFVSWPYVCTCHCMLIYLYVYYFIVNFFMLRQKLLLFTLGRVVV